MSSLFTTDRSDFSGSNFTPIDRGEDATFSEVWDASFNRFERAYRSTGHERGLVLELEQTVQEAVDAGYESDRIASPFAGLPNPAQRLLEGNDTRGEGERKFARELEKLNRFRADNGLGEPIIREDLDAIVRSKAVSAEEVYQDTHSDWFNEFFGAMGPAVINFFADINDGGGPAGIPIAILGAKYKALGNASQKFLGTGTALSVARVAAIDTLVGGGQELWLQAGIKQWRDDIKLRHTYGDMAEAVGVAAIGSGVIRGLGSTGMGASKAADAALRPERALGREMLATPGLRADAGEKYVRETTELAGLNLGKQQAISRDINSLTPQQLSDGFRVLEEAGAKIPAVARGALNALEREADLADNSPFKADDAAARRENEERISAEIVNIFAEGEARIDLPPTTREVAELDVHHYDNLDGEIFRFNPQEIGVDAKMFQFKAGGDEFGVGERLQGVTNWDPAMSGHVSVYEFADGRRFIADGHQRLGLAKRIQSQDPSQKIQLYGRLYRESDGITPETAMVDSALINIAQGTGSVIDAAKVLKIDPEALGKRLPPRSPLVRTANDLVRLSDEAFGLVVNEIVPANYAATVGRLVRDPSKQEAILRVLKDTDPSNLTQAESIVRQAMDTEFTVATQDTLFGEEMLVESLFKERAKVLDETIKMLRKDRAVFNSLVENQQRIESGGNKLETSQNAAKAETDGQAIQILQIQANRKGPLSDALNAAAKAFKETGRAAPAARDFASDVRGAIERGDINRLPERGEVIDVDAPPQIDSIAASHVERLDDFAEPGGKGYEDQANMLEREAVEVAEIDGVEDLLDMMIPTVREDANLNEVVEMRSVEDLFRDIEQDTSMLNRLKDCT